MGIFTAWRIRVIGIVVVGVALWQSRTAHAGLLRGSWGSLPLAMVAIWVVGLFVIYRPRMHLWLLALMVAASAVLVRFAPGTAIILIATYGACGARMSWRWLRILGLPLVLAGAWWLNYPLTAARLTGFVDSAITLAIVLLLGRFSRDNEEGRAAQTRALADLQKAHRDLQAYAAQVEELSALRERTRVARELHDTLGHALSAITVQLEAVRRLQRRDPAAVEPMLVETQALARQAMQELRQYLAGLRADLDDGDLAPALEALAGEAAARNGWQLTLQLAPAPVPRQVRRTLKQVAREALTNIERHAGAHIVSIRLGCEGDDILLAISDDGRGFDPGSRPSGHFGLQGMRERLAELHGELCVVSSPGHGSRVTARVPLAPAAALPLPEGP